MYSTTLVSLCTTRINWPYLNDTAFSWESFFNDLCNTFRQWRRLRLNSKREEWRIHSTHLNSSSICHNVSIYPHQRKSNTKRSECTMKRYVDASRWLHSIPNMTWQHNLAPLIPRCDRATHSFLHSSTLEHTIHQQSIGGNILLTAGRYLLQECAKHPHKLPTGWEHIRSDNNLHVNKKPLICQHIRIWHF